MITSLYRKPGRNAAAHETSGDEPEQGDFFTHVALLATTNFPHFAPDAISWWLEWHKKAINIAKAGREAVQSGSLKSYIDNFLYIPTETARKKAREEIRSAWRYLEIGRIVGE